MQHELTGMVSLCEIVNLPGCINIPSYAVLQLAEDNYKCTHVDRSLQKLRLYGTTELHATLPSSCDYTCM